MPFAQDGYELVDNAISIDTCEILAGTLQITADVVYHQTNSKIEDFRFGDVQVPKSFHHYGSVWSESLLTFLLPKVEEVTGKKLFPTYSYTRIYYPGSKLDLHRDREECEYSVTLTLKVEGDNWPIHFFDRQNAVKTFTVPQGSMLIYKGVELHHWRRQMPDTTRLLYQVFLHYVDQHGLFSDRNLDGRAMLGLDIRKS